MVMFTPKFVDVLQIEVIEILRKNSITTGLGVKTENYPTVSLVQI